MSYSELACQAVHISPQTMPSALLVSSATGSAVQMLPTVKAARTPFTPPPRMPIERFSRASRLRLLWMLAEIDEKKLAKSLFVTLTYPKMVEGLDMAKTHLDSFLKQIQRTHPNSSTVWKLEYTKLGTPHFHLLILGVGYWHHGDVARAWARIVASDHPMHGQAGTRIERLHSKRHPARYIAKYVSKHEKHPPGTYGRFWGKVGNLTPYLSPKHIYSLRREEHLRLRRLLDLLRKARCKRRRFRRASHLGHAQRWFLSGQSVASLLMRSMNLAPMALDTG